MKRFALGFITCFLLFLGWDVYAILDWNWSRPSMMQWGYKAYGDFICGDDDKWRGIVKHGSFVMYLECYPEIGTPLPLDLSEYEKLREKLDTNL